MVALTRIRYASRVRAACDIAESHAHRALPIDTPHA
jgi:hypothetical protein